MSIQKLWHCLLGYASYIQLCLSNDTDGQHKTKIYDKIDNTTFQLPATYLSAVVCPSLQCIILIFFQKICNVHACSHYMNYLTMMCSLHTTKLSL